MGSGPADEPAAGPPPVAGAVRAALIGCAILAAVAALAPALGGELVYDDLSLVARNPALADARGLAEHLFRPHWDFVEREARSLYWRPLAVLALFAGKALGGTVAHHALSLAIHAVAIAVAFLLAERISRSTGVGFATALLFGLHPVQVEPVAWISATNDPLSGAFLLASLLAFVRWRDRGSIGTPIAAPALLFAALLSKESALAWLALAPAIDFALARARPGAARPVVRAYAPALVAVAAYVFARILVFGETSAGLLRVSGSLDLPPARDLAIRAELLGGALRLLAWPAGLNLFRELRPELPEGDPTLWIALAAISAWLAAVAIAWRRRLPVVLAALLAIAAALAPLILRYEAAGRFPLSERFLYVSTFGFALLVATLAVRNLPRAAAALAIGALALGYGVRGHARTGFWRDEPTLFRASAEANPRSVYVQWGLGRVLLGEYQRTGDTAKLLEARDAFLRAQDLVTERDPSVLSTWFDELQSSLGLGWYHLFCALAMPEECVIDEAEGVFRALAEKAPWRPEPHSGLGVALRHMGRLDEAEAELRAALDANPAHYESWHNLAQLSLAREKWADALAQLERCLEIAPDDPQVWLQIGIASVELDDGERARRALARARALAPESAEPQVQLGIMAAREERPEVALDFFEQALKLDGAHGIAHLYRAKALVQLSRPLEALNAFLDASRWLQEPSRDPHRPRQVFEAFYNAGVLALSLGRNAEALPMLEEAAKRDPERRWTPPSFDERLEELREELRAPGAR